MWTPTLFGQFPIFVHSDCFQPFAVTNLTIQWWKEHTATTCDTHKPPSYTVKWKICQTQTCMVWFHLQNILKPTGKTKLQCVQMSTQEGNYKGKKGYDYSRSRVALSLWVMRVLWWERHLGAPKGWQCPGSRLGRVCMGVYNNSLSSTFMFYGLLSICVPFNDKIFKWTELKY